MASKPITPLEGGIEMFSRGKTQPLFPMDLQLSNRSSLLSIVPELETSSILLGVPNLQHSTKARPVSEITEIFDEDDLEDNDDLSEFEEDSEGWSFESNDCRRSQTTISSFDEAPTPQSGRRPNYFQFEARKSVEGPRGPHLFRSSYASDLSFDFALQLSPILPKRQELKIDTAFNRLSTTPTTITEAPAFTASAVPAWNSGSPKSSLSDSPKSWTTGQVAYWMSTSGIDTATVDQFEFHDITGTVLMDLKFEDLKELGIQSFGKRHEVWNKICSLREGDGRISPVPTPFEDVSQRSSRENCHEEAPITPGAGRRRRRKYRQKGNEPITPADSVSIVAIEQLIPKPHSCDKGENCPKWKKQQRLLRRINEEHGLPVSPEHGGHILMTGDPGNAFRAPNILEHVRPASEAEPSVVGPSVVASSDLLGPGDSPQILNPELLKRLEERDAQDNVRQFLNFQHLAPMSPVEDAPLEMFPAQHPPQSASAPLPSLQCLPRLQIPRSNTAIGFVNASGVEIVEDPFSAFSPCRTAAASPGGLYRFGTPASEMDVPVTAVPTGPLSRETTQSVPPNMQFRDPVERTSSRVDWRRPSMQLPSLKENEVFTPPTSDDASSRRSSNTLANGASSSNDTPNRSSQASQEEIPNPDPRYPGVSHAGWMKKRKTKMLRHEWNDHHFRLAGNNLAMHRNDIPQSAVLESLNIDQYAVGCSTVASGKLSTKFKALKIASKDKTAPNDAAFEFQLVPDQLAKGKTHHFAVKSKDQRIDWMRELMLAKALKAKRDGFDVQVNGKTNTEV